MARGALPSKRSKALIAHARDSISQGLLAQAGVTPHFVAKAVQRINEALDAKVTKRIVVEGQIHTFNDIDHRTRLSGADRAIDLASRESIVPGKQTSMDAGGSIRVFVRLADGQVVGIEAKHG